MLGNLVSNAVNGGGQIQKDTVNTAVSHHAGRTLALMEQSRPSLLQTSRDGRLTTLAADSDLGGDIAPVPVLGGALSAHSRIDPTTGDLVSVSYSTALPPYLRQDVWDRDGTLKSSIGIDTPAPVMVHDLAITARSTVLLDLPMTVRIERTLVDTFPVEYEPAAGARIGVLSRETGTVQWADVRPCVVLHTANAYEIEEGGRKRVVVTALRSVPSGPQSYICSYTPAFLYRWTLDLAGGEATCVDERHLSAVPCEFPMVNPRFHGSPASRYVYCITPSSAGGPLTDFSTPDTGILVSRGEWRSETLPVRGETCPSPPHTRRTTDRWPNHAGHDHRTNSGRVSLRGRA